MILTSNRTRDIHDALKRRCLYHWIDDPDPEKERSIISARVPGIEGNLALQMALLMESTRREDLVKKPGISETLDWAGALVLLQRDVLDEKTVEQTLSCILKYREDVNHFRSLWDKIEYRRSLLYDARTAC